MKNVVELGIIIVCNNYDVMINHGLHVAMTMPMTIKMTMTMKNKIVTINVQTSIYRETVIYLKKTFQESHMELSDS